MQAAAPFYACETDVSVNVKINDKKVLAEHPMFGPYMQYTLHQMFAPFLQMIEMQCPGEDKEKFVEDWLKNTKESDMQGQMKFMYSMTKFMQASKDLMKEIKDFKVSACVEFAGQIELSFKDKANGVGPLAEFIYATMTLPTRF